MFNTGKHWISVFPGETELRSKNSQYKGDYTQLFFEKQKECKGKSNILS